MCGYEHLGSSRPLQITINKSVSVFFSFRLYGLCNRFHWAEKTFNEFYKLCHFLFGDKSYNKKRHIKAFQKFNRSNVSKYSSPHLKWMSITGLGIVRQVVCLPTVDEKEISKSSPKNDKTKKRVCITERSSRA